MEDKTVIATAPPPPSEVKIRTMSSDINSMKLSGGGAPTYQTVAIAGLSAEKKFNEPLSFVATPMPTAGAIQRPSQENVFPAAPGAPERPVLGEEVADAGPGADLIPKLIVGAVALIAILVVGFFAISIFSK